MNRYASGASASAHAPAETVKTVLSAVPALGVAVAAPPVGAPLALSVAKAAASPLASETSRRTVYRYPSSSRSGAIARLAEVSDSEFTNPSAVRSTASSSPPAAGTRTHDHANATDASASVATTDLSLATSPELTRPSPPAMGAMDALGGAPDAPATADTTVTVDVALETRAPFLASSENAYL